MHDEPRHDAASRTDDISGDANTGEQEATRTVAKTARKTARDRSKRDTKYWLSRVFRPIAGDGSTSRNFAVKIQHRGRRVAFGLFTPNRDAAAKRAQALFNDVVERGWDAVIAERRGGNVPDENIATIGAWIEAARSVFDGRPETFAGYVRSLRQIASEIVGTGVDLQKFDPRHCRNHFHLPTSNSIRANR